MHLPAIDDNLVVLIDREKHKDFFDKALNVFVDAKVLADDLRTICVTY